VNEIIVRLRRPKKGLTMKLIIAFGVALLLASPARAGAFLSGNVLYEKCSRDATFCQGYVAGIADALETAHQVCTPENVTLAQVVGVVKAYLWAHPEARHYTASSETAMALVNAFPDHQCAPEQDPRVLAFLLPESSISRRVDVSDYEWRFHCIVTNRCRYQWLDRRQTLEYLRSLPSG
jgi:hypothetical protein